jgi:hypothetical protein
MPPAAAGTSQGSAGWAGSTDLDYVLTGGDYDFLLLNLVNHLTHNEDVEPGIWYRKNDSVKRCAGTPNRSRAAGYNYEYKITDNLPNSKPSSEEILY